MEPSLIEPAMINVLHTNSDPCHKILIISNDQELIFRFRSLRLEVECDVISCSDLGENDFINLRQYSLLAIDVNLDDFSGVHVVQLMNEIRKNPTLNVLHITTDSVLLRAKSAFLQEEPDHLIDIVANEDHARQMIMKQLNGVKEDMWSFPVQDNSIALPRPSVIEAKDIIDSLNYAAVMQKSLYMSKRNDRDRFNDCFILSEPKDLVGGDFYWLDYVNHKQISVCADCTGHGVPGAMLTMMGHQIVENIIRTQRVLDPGQILTQVHQRFLDVFGWDSPLRHQGMDISICVYDPGTRILEYASAKGKILLQKGNDLIRLDGDMASVGDLMKPSIRFKTTQIQIKETAWLFQYTDGIVDQFGGGNDKKFKFPNLKHSLCTNIDKTSEQIKALLWKQHQVWKGSLEQTDDLTILGYKIG